MIFYSSKQGDEAHIIYESTSIRYIEIFDDYRRNKYSSILETEHYWKIDDDIVGELPCNINFHKKYSDEEFRRLSAHLVDLQLYRNDVSIKLLRRN